jgi:uncharacterized protein YjbI with pentapeptide repeats
MVGVALAAVGLGVAWLLFVPTADWLAHHDVGSVKGALHETALDNARGRLLTLGAGLFAAGALLFTARNFILSREGQVTDRYTKAIEQLGSDKLDIRIGGIFALERIARDSARDHQAVIDALAAFIREHSHEQWPVPKKPVPKKKKKKIQPAPQATRPDVQAAITVVGRRDAKRDIRSVDLTGVDLPGADLTEAQLAGANLTGADLSRAQLAGANLTGATLNDAYLALTDFTGATLTGADLGDAYLGGATLERADLSGAKLQRADLDHARLDFANLGGANLVGATLPSANLVAVNLAGAELNCANLSDVNLGNAKLTNANLPGVNFTGAGLLDADLTGACLYDAWLGNANFTGVDLSLVNLTNVRWPPSLPLPEGWKWGATGRVARADTDSGPMEPN